MPSPIIPDRLTPSDLPPSRPAKAPSSLGSFFALSLLIGVIGFGGSFAIAHRIRRSVVEEKAWLDDPSFLEYFAVASALPGSAATNLLTMLGLRFGGVYGATLAAVLFLAPSIVLMIAFGLFYENLRSVETLSVILDGMSVATVGVVAAVVLDMGRTSLRNRWAIVLAGSAALALVFRALSLLEVIALAGAVGAFALRPAAHPRKAVPEVQPRQRGSFHPSVLFLPIISSAGIASAFSLFVVFARIGIATFGGGFAAIAPIEREIVFVRQWLSIDAFNHAMVLGQITPGPVVIAATFIGYRVDGVVGALSATLGMFTPPFIATIVASRSLDSFRTNSYMQGFLHGVAPTIVGVIGAASVLLWRTSVHSVVDGALAAGVFILLACVPKLSPLVPLFGTAMFKLVAHSLFHSR